MASPQVSPSESTERVLARALRGRRRSAFEGRLVEVLHHDIFRRVDDLSTSEACALSYERMRYLRRALDLRIDDLFSDLDRLLALHEWTALVDGTATTLLTIHYNLCVGSILRHGDARPELRPYLAELETMDAVGVFLATELAYGCNVQALETTATYDPAAREFVLHTPTPHAQKFMPNTGAPGIGKLAVVLARLVVDGRAHGIYPFIVRIRTQHAVCPGVRVSPLGDKPDFPLDNAITSFDHLRVPFRDWLRGGESYIDETGAFSSGVAPRRRFLNCLDRVQTGKLCLGVAVAAGARAALQITWRYAQQRRTFAQGKTDVRLIDYRTYQRALFEGIATTCAATFLLRDVAARYRARTAVDELEVNRLLAVAKVFASSRSAAVLAMCRERVGAQGLFSANRLIPYWIQANGVVTAEGDNEVLSARTARELVSARQREPEPDEPPSPGSVLDSQESLLWIFRAHEERVRRRVAAAMARARRSSAFDAWNESLADAMHLASVHATRQALESFHRGIQRADAASARAVFDRLFRLFAMQEMARYGADLTADGTINRDVASRLEPERARIVAELFADLDLLESIFDVPPAMLGAPISGDYIAAYDRLGVDPPPRTSIFRLRAPGKKSKGKARAVSAAASESRNRRRRANGG